MLCVYKCTHIRIRGTTNFSRLFLGKRFKFIKSRDRRVAFYSYMRVETVYRFVSNAPNGELKRLLAVVLGASHASDLLAIV